MEPFAYKNSFTCGENVIPQSSQVPQLHPQKCTQILGATAISWLATSNLMRFGRISNCWTSEAVHGLASCSLMNLIPIKVTKITFLEIDITPWALKDGSASLIYVVVFDSNERADCAVRLWNSATNFHTPPLFDVAVFALPAVFILATSCKLNDFVKGNTNRIRSWTWTVICWNFINWIYQQDFEDSPKIHQHD